jgi:hypothetical protein
MGRFLGERKESLVHSRGQRWGSDLCPLGGCLQAQRLDVEQLLRRDPFAPFQLGDEALVEGQQFLEPPGLSSNHLSVL